MPRRDYVAAMHLRPGDADLPVWYGAALGDSGDAAGALRAFDKALELDPNHFAAHMNRGKVLADLGRYPEAAAACDRAIALDPANGVARDGRCWVRAVIGRDLPGALDDCDRAIAAMPGAANPLNNRGLVHFRMGRMSESIADYTASIEADPGMVSSYYVRSLARSAQGDGAAADRDLAEALATADGVINTTPVGMAKFPGTPVPAALLRPELWVAEIIYFPLETELLRVARSLGCRTLDGGGMAVFQAVDAFRLITGAEPDAQRMQRHAGVDAFVIRDNGAGFDMRYRDNLLDRKSVV